METKPHRYLIIQWKGRRSSPFLTAEKWSSSITVQNIVILMPTPVPSSKQLLARFSHNLGGTRFYWCTPEIHHNSCLGCWGVL